VPTKKLRLEKVEALRGDIGVLENQINLPLFLKLNHPTKRLLAQDTHLFLKSKTE